MEQQIFSWCEFVPDDPRHEHLGMMKAPAGPTMMTETMAGSLSYRMPKRHGSDHLEKYRNHK
jgi:hypothetical protein